MRPTTTTIGLVLAAVLSISDLATAAVPGPPVPAIVVATALGAASLAAVALAWRGGRGRLWAVAALRSVSALMATLGLFDDGTAAGVRGLIVGGLVLTAVMLALIAPDLRRAPAASPAA
ncbi:hypothetical protein [Actinomadura verrucosospora]|uniref:Uncharacterized protein n=1 Tax=Actinomadura verrucosospora TaxID=46165 RepID=A0A7D3ZRS5_ACTVE|nr:hypothetical protein [Actinomadura verrucosospora]QKG25923.1 hypothetical protein ACTIVE_7576 [Actinomadura verrucosospora]